MSLLPYVKLQDAKSAEGSAQPPNPLNVEPLLGTWRNTNIATKGITTAVLRRDNSNIQLQVYGSGENEANDWGPTDVTEFYAEGIGTQQAISFTANYDFGFLETELQTNLSKGLLIISTVNTFKDNSSRSNYFSREYFYKEPQGV